MARIDEDYAEISKWIKTWDLNIINNNQLKLGKTIAVGGQGKIKIGELGNTVVIVKFLYNPRKEAFKREVLISYKYRHPNIQKFIGVYECENNYGIVLEHWDGKDLTAIIRSENKGILQVSLIQKLDYLIQWASVVEFLHSHSWIHMDLKTDNIIIDHWGNLKVLDFGSSIEGKQRRVFRNSGDYEFHSDYVPGEIVKQDNDWEDINEDNEEDEDEDEDEAEEDDDDDDDECNEFEEDDKNEQDKDKTTVNKYSNNHTKLINNKLTKVNNNEHKNCKLTYHPVRKITLTGTDQRVTKYDDTKKQSWSNCNKSLKTKEMSSSGVIKITYKYDIWAFGLIMRYLFTLCTPWEKQQIPGEKRPNINKQRFTNGNQENRIGNWHPREECKKYDNEIKEIILCCLKYDPDQRADIKEIKVKLWTVFNSEVSNQSQVYAMMQLKRINQENKYIYEIWQTVDDDKKRNIVRWNKWLVRKEIDLNTVHKLNIIANKRTDTCNKKEYSNKISNRYETKNDNKANPQALIRRINERAYKDNPKIGNKMLETWKESNYKKLQKLKIQEHEIFELRYLISEKGTEV